jgi:hypothetical protein
MQKRDPLATEVDIVQQDQEATAKSGTDGELPVANDGFESTKARGGGSYSLRSEPHKNLLSTPKSPANIESPPNILCRTAGTLTSDRKYFLTEHLIILHH